MHALLLKTQSSCPQLVTVHLCYTTSAWLQLQLCIAGPANVASHDCLAAEMAARSRSACKPESLLHADSSPMDSVS